MQFCRFNVQNFEEMYIIHTHFLNDVDNFVHL